VKQYREERGGRVVRIIDSKIVNKILAKGIW
jgi:hypothetical protein